MKAKGLGWVVQCDGGDIGQGNGQLSGPDSKGRRIVLHVGVQEQRQDKSNGHLKCVGVGG